MKTEEYGYGADSRYYGHYEYNINGEKNIIILETGGKRSPTVTLYYTDSPRKVFTKNVKLGCWSISIYIIPIMAAILIMKLLGYKA